MKPATTAQPATVSRRVILKLDVCQANSSLAMTVSSVTEPNSVILSKTASKDRRLTAMTASNALSIPATKP
jgi:hypothetical protein